MDKSNPATAFLGIECGGTRTIALFAPGNGEPVLRAEFGPANLRMLDDSGLTDQFKTVDGIRRESSGQLAGIAIGMAGARTDFDRQRIRAAAATVWPNVPCNASNDLEIAMAAQEPDADTEFAARILILSGTGSSLLRANFSVGPPPGARRLGPHYSGDKGSGYVIGLRGIKAAVYYLDRDGRWTGTGPKYSPAIPSFN